MADAEMAQAGPVAGPSGSSGPPKKRFEVKKWNAVAVWSWSIWHAPWLFPFEL